MAANGINPGFDMQYPSEINTRASPSPSVSSARNNQANICFSGYQGDAVAWGQDVHTPGVLSQNRATVYLLRVFSLSK